MEKDKYYAPSIEEIHIGLEIEYRSRLQGLTNSVAYKSEIEYVSHWRNCKISMKPNGLEPYPEPRMLHKIEEDIENNAIRIKRLDQEDIESVLDLSVFSYIFEEGLLELKVLSEVRFKGVCKNKNELKRIVESIRY